MPIPRTCLAAEPLCPDSAAADRHAAARRRPARLGGGDRRRFHRLVDSVASGRAGHGCRGAGGARAGLGRIGTQWRAGQSRAEARPRPGRGGFRRRSRPPHGGDVWQRAELGVRPGRAPPDHLRGARNPARCAPPTTNRAPRRPQHADMAPGATCRSSCWTAGCAPVTGTTGTSRAAGPTRRAGQSAGLCARPGAGGEPGRRCDPRPHAGAELSRDGSWQVETPTGTVRAEKLVLATNGYTDDLWPGLRRSIVPVFSGIVATEPIPEDVARTIMPMRSVAVRNRQGHRLLPARRTTAC